MILFLNISHIITNLSLIIQLPIYLFSLIINSQKGSAKILKITFLDTASTVFSCDLLGNCMYTPILCECEIALCDINVEHLNKSHMILNTINKDPCYFIKIKNYIYLEYTLRYTHFIINAILVNFPHNFNIQLLTIETTVIQKKAHIYQAAMLDPHTASELSIPNLITRVDELL